ncbi:MAG TPA: RDD family protein [Mycobacterium sp.]|nr:RDD family protein [Mycobacterium sp.]
MARSVSSWLSGPEPAGSDAGEGYPGKSLGLPESGSRSLARTGRRLAALIVDWLACYGIAALLMTFGVFGPGVLSTAVLVIWFAVGALSVRLFGFSPGQLALGLQVVPADGRLHVGFGRALVRGVLLALVIPALFMDADGRGLHDRLSFTAVVRR